MVTVGRLNKQIELKKPVETSDGSGGTSRVWETFATVWAEIAPVRGDRLIEAKGMNTEIAFRITIRYIATFLSGWRVKYGARIFDVLHIVNPNEAGKTLELYAKEHV